ncbi:HVA1 family protein [Streptomyces sp. SID2955]|nr:HVA1 family protein [Streptomyces sp. SID2955]
MAKGKHSSGGREPAEGDKVAWRSHGTETAGTVEKKITERTEAAGRTVAASPDDPQYEVRSDKSGRTAVHKPSALRKKK